MEALHWERVARGVYRARLGRTPNLTPMKLRAAEPSRGLFDLPDADAPAVGEASADGRTLVVRFPLSDDEALYGLGLQMRTLEHRGRVYSLSVNSFPTSDNGENAAPTPLLVSSAGYALAVDTQRVPTFYLGVTQPRSLPVHPLSRSDDDDWTPTPPCHCWEVTVDGEDADVYFFAGPKMLDAVRRYVLYAGGGAAAPRWALGVWHRVPIRYTADEALAEMRAFREHAMRASVIGLEPGWHSCSYPTSYAWSNRFPDPAAFVREAAKLGFRINLWENPYVSPKCAYYERVKPQFADYAHWNGEVPDYSREDVRKAMGEQHDREHVAIGVSGYKLDECDRTLPPHARFPSGMDGERLNQMLGLLLSREIRDLYAARGEETYGMVRSGNLATCGYPFALYTDRSDLREYVRMLCNSGFSGLVFSPEACGAKDAREWVRRLQVACLSGHAQLNAWASGMKPWSFPEVEENVRALFLWRARLEDYLFDAFRCFHENGTPPVRALALDFEDDANCRAIDDEYLLGSDILVAPVFGEADGRRVYFPGGAWRALDGEERYERGWHDVALPLDRLPAFAREGAKIPFEEVTP